MVKLSQARQEPYNLIIVDWQMPEMDGVETAKNIRSLIGADTAVIILTAYNWDDIYEEAMDAGVDSFIAKPLFTENLINEFKNVLKKKKIAAESIRKAELEGRRVILAEDIEVNAQIMMKVLSMRKIEADHAVNGKEAVELYKNKPEGYYDAILMDMRMPEMDGLTATRNIRALGRADSASIPIIALTANAFDEDVQLSLQAGLNAHLSKPVEPAVLFETLEKLIKPASRSL
jgi:CheY-like chemotaxis protein